MVLDQAISHISENNKNQMISENKNVTYIPPAMTRLFQSLDVCVNKPLKDAIKEKYLDYCIKIKDNNAKISRSKKVDDKIISNKLVYKSFWTKGINNNLDSKEDYSFSSLKKMNN